MKRLLSVTALLAFCLLLLMPFGACIGVVTIPNVSDVDENCAKYVICSNGLIPKIEYIYNDNIKEGNIVKTLPEINTRVSKNSQVTLYVSKGSAYVSATDARIEWYNISSKNDDWQFDLPYIEENVLYINLHSVTFSEALTWYDRYQKGFISGDASTNSNFEESVPISAIYVKQSWNANESQSFLLEIPLSSLENKRPPSIYIRLYGYMKEELICAKVNFSIAW